VQASQIRSKRASDRRNAKRAGGCTECAASGEEEEENIRELNSPPCAKADPKRKGKKRATLSEEVREEHEEKEKPDRGHRPPNKERKESSYGDQ